MDFLQIFSKYIYFCWNYGKTSSTFIFCQFFGIWFGVESLAGRGPLESTEWNYLLTKYFPFIQPAFIFIISPERGWNSPNQNQGLSLACDLVNFIGWYHEHFSSFCCSFQRSWTLQLFCQTCRQTSLVLLVHISHTSVMKKKWLISTVNTDQITLFKDQIIH